MDYRTASAALRQAGFYVEIENAASTQESYQEDLVLSCSPAVGSELGVGSTVTLTVSCGTMIDQIQMPNLVGLSETAAIAQIETKRLSYGGSVYASSDLASGTVIRTEPDKFTGINEHSKVILYVSTGPVAG